MSISVLTDFLELFALVFGQFPILIWVLSAAVICSLVALAKYIIRIRG